mmetsp:Transcript_43433/g.122801  ORF Transcript_43433/g.122801 Transcript_43433/m.122801 type:complete len:145 (-) Transcript_43433:211-645(-)|eukprot:CAMPEP_0176249654 /NCGR_PEP_ID=MMETSP0121_2-20121125/34088_1 /TAXON_ID=160619 /ORGANISM="Kryptoperidinium foliaceum, Strain CCMP 1326" /LENGTH=144 /DNA_ID=CAMNT_0017589359 /DNA_START=70 /DNA_END=504 /DNA_ORIENTATION=+
MAATDAINFSADSMMKDNISEASTALLTSEESGELAQSSGDESTPRCSVDEEEDEADASSPMSIVRTGKAVRRKSVRFDMEAVDTLTYQISTGARAEKTKEKRQQEKKEKGTVAQIQAGLSELGASEAVPFSMVCASFALVLLL